MKFLIQKINGEIRHDFAYTLLDSIRFNNWCRNPTIMKVKYLDYIEVQEPDDIYPIQFKPMHKNYVPVGSVEFVTEFLGHFYGLKPTPMNVPEELFKFAGRQIANGNHMDFETVVGGKYYVKSNTKIKGFSELVEIKSPGMLPIPPGEYQVSQLVKDIESEWRAFVYEGKLVGLQNYSGDFTVFPSVEKIKEMIKVFQDSDSAPIAYTLDVAVVNNETIIIEAHDFFSCGLYGFSDSILPHMLYRWFEEYLFINF